MLLGSGAAGSPEPPREGDDRDGVVVEVADRDVPRASARPPLGCHDTQAGRVVAAREPVAGVEVDAIGRDHAVVCGPGS
jgi:hypothetical protein